MKNTMTIIFALFLFAQANAQSDTIVGWSFASDSTELAVMANYGLPVNLNNFSLQAEVESTGDTLEVYMTNGAGGSGDYAATAEGWDNGANDKFYAIEFKADGYSDFLVSSKMRAAGNNPGPRFWKLQYKLEGGSWADIPNGDFEIANNWSTGVVEDLPMPADVNNPGSSSVFIRWIMTSNEDINGVDVLPTGRCKIDDIIVTALNYNDVEEIVVGSQINLYPNPSDGLFSVECSDRIEMILVMNMHGQIVYESHSNAALSQIDLRSFAKGMFIIKMKPFNSNKYISKKIIVGK
jgi:hypothetical protein